MPFLQWPGLGLTFLWPDPTLDYFTLPLSTFTSFYVTLDLLVPCRPDLELTLSRLILPWPVCFQICFLVSTLWSLHPFRSVEACQAPHPWKWQRSRSSRRSRNMIRLIQWRRPKAVSRLSISLRTCRVGSWTSSCLRWVERVTRFWSTAGQDLIGFFIQSIIQTSLCHLFDLSSIVNMSLCLSVIVHSFIRCLTSLCHLLDDGHH